jgi:teichoic acid transport system ATP-binding protein
MEDNVAIRISNIYEKNIDRLKEIINPFKKKYSKEFYALNDISLDINKGEVVGIIGKNGAGKSTLLKIITGVLSPTAGSIEVNGNVASLLELGAGFNMEMTGIENIYMNGIIMGYSRKAMDKKLKDIIEFADIGDFIYQPVKMYSSGMFARLAFAVNVNVEPQILIVDEALAVGDAFFSQKCLYKMQQMQKKGITVLFVSHDISMIKALCSRCIYLKEGRKIADGMADKICDMYQNSTTNVKQQIFVDDNKKTQIKITDEKIGIEDFRIDEDFARRMTERSGGGELEFTAFDFYDNGNRVTTQKMFKDIHIKISGIVHKNIAKGAAIGILCRDRMGNDVFNGNLNIFDVYMPEMQKGEQFVLNVKFEAPLAPGEYFWGIGAKPHPLSDYFYDRGFNVAKISIEQNDDMGKYVGGIIAVKLKKFELFARK